MRQRINPGPADERLWRRTAIVIIHPYKRGGVLYFKVILRRQRNDPGRYSRKSVPFQHHIRCRTGRQVFGNDRICIFSIGISNRCLKPQGVGYLSS